MKQEYPYYWVSADVWIPPDENHDEGEYFIKGIFQSENKEEAEKVFKETQMTPDFIHIQLFEEWEDETIRLAYKDLVDDDDNPVEEVWGE